MTISDKTRKILWGRSGNRCAICKHELVIDATDKDDEAIVGDECHIISPTPNGPRNDPTFPEKQLDEYDNLMLLCRVHHKMIDDQEETYTASILHEMKENHERWISEKLTDQHPKPIRFRRIRKNMPDYLVRLTTGKQLFDLVANTMAYYMDHDELSSKAEVDLVGDLFQDVQDLCDMGNELEPRQRVEYAYQLTQTINQLEEAGFFVFGAREMQIIEGGVEPSSNWPVAIVNVLRKDNKVILYGNPDGLENTSA